ncbi:MAG: DNA/RNA non-specific endonuclease [Bacteroidetes bacterium]|nr:DNA/RNA non-specific endonuclease [Bacteroidota bacterium]
MKKNILLFSLILHFTFAFTQDYDTIIKTKIYTSYFNYNQKAASVLTYKLYKGGGDCDRKGFHFINDIKTLATATDNDYAGKPYDKGHLANAEDFAYDCELDKITFRYYNCVPQTSKMNRGVWKTYETKIRKLSQTDSLQIIIVNVFDNNYMGSGVGVPVQCIKAVYSLSKKKFIMSFSVSNSTVPLVETLSIAALNKKYSIDIDKFRK